LALFKSGTLNVVEPSPTPYGATTILVAPLLADIAGLTVIWVGVKPVIVVPELIFVPLMGIPRPILVVEATVMVVVDVMVPII
jgi:hypothetical protein